MGYDLEGVVARITHIQTVQEKIRKYSVVNTLHDPRPVKRCFSEIYTRSLEKRKKYFLEDMEITTTSYSTVT
jgi:hypothetical protein